MSTINGIQVAQSGTKLRARTQSKATRDCMEAVNNQTPTYMATELICDDSGQVIDVTMVEVPRAQVKGVIPGFAEKHARSVHKANTLGKRGS